MKKLTAFIAMAAMLFASCTRDVKSPASNNNNNISNSTVVTGTFTITKFTDDHSAEDKTSYFSGYAFAFNTGGKIIAEKNGITVTGSYTEKPSHEGEGAKLTISFGDAPLNELNKNWLINLISDSAIHLSDDDASSGEVLEFTAQ